MIIVYWKNAETIAECLAALAEQSCSDFEVIIIDNGSADGGLDRVLPSFCRLNLRLERLPENRGFAAANNRGAQLAQGRWLALLNADAFPAREWLAALLEAARRHPEFAFFGSRLVQARDHCRLDGTGDVYHISGLAWRRDYDAPVDRAQTEEEVFSPCGAAALYLRDAFLSVGGFDQDFFSYHEDVDLGFRLRLQGGRCLYVPKAVVYHVGSASYGKKSDFVIYHGHRNLVWTFVQDMPAALFWRYLPAHLLATLIPLVYYSLRGHATAIWRAKLDALRGLPQAWRKRRQTQHLLRVEPSELSGVMEHSWRKFLHSSWQRRD